jgi:hypothetical protein
MFGLAKNRVLPSYRVDRIRRVSRKNRCGGASRIHGELLKLGFEVAQSTVSKLYDTTSKGTVANVEAEAIAAVDLCVVPTLTFERFVCVPGSRARSATAIRFEVKRYPTAAWLARQITEAFPWTLTPSYLVRDNDSAYGHVFTSRVRAVGTRDRPISPGSPWHNGIAERLIGTLRRECLDQVVCILQSGPHAPGSPERCTFVSSSPIHPRHSDLGWAAPSICPRI